MKAKGTNSDYVVEFVHGHDYNFASNAVRPENIDQDVIVGGRTSTVSLNNTSPGVSDKATDIDAGIKGSGNARLQVTGGFQFTDPSYSVSEDVKSGYLTISVMRTSSYDQRTVVVKTGNGTAIAGTNYISVT